MLNTHCFSHEDMIFLINLINKKLADHFEKTLAREQQRKTEDYDEVLEETLERQVNFKLYIFFSVLFNYYIKNLMLHFLLFQDDDDVYILSKISDVVCTLFSTYKQEFFPYFDTLLPQYILLLVSIATF